MRIMGTSFFLGIMATIILGITLLSIAIYDIACHRIRHVIKYLFFILMGILLIIFSLLFTVTGGTNLLLVLREIDIDYDKEIAFAFAIFTCWSLFIAVRYYGYVLLPEYSNLNNIKKDDLSFFLYANSWVDCTMVVLADSCVCDRYNTLLFIILLRVYR